MQGWRRAHHDDRRPACRDQHAGRAGAPSRSTRSFGSRRERLKAIVQSLAPADLPIRSIVGEGSVYREVLRVAEEIGADLIVLVSHRPALKCFLLGAHAASVVRHAPCSAYVVRPS